MSETNNKIESTIQATETAEQLSSKNVSSEKSEKVEITPQIIFNRQVNYFILRSLYKYVMERMGRKSHGMEGFYNSLEMPRNKVTKIITGYGKEVITNNRVEKIQDKLGISAEAILGKKLLSIPKLNEQSWCNYLNDRYGSRYGVKEENNGVQIVVDKKYKVSHSGYYTDITAILSEEFIRIPYIDEIDLVAVCHYYQTKTKYAADDLQFQMERVKIEMGKVRIGSNMDLRDKLDLMRTYQASLKQELVRISAVINYYDLIK